MKKEIQTILEELYAIDPALRQHEPELEKVILNMLAHKPDVHVDRQFAEHLRERLMTTQHSKEQHKTYSSFLSKLFMNKLPVMVGTGAVLSLFLVVGVYQYNALQQPPLSGGSMASLFSPAEIVQKKPGAFGSLAANFDAGGVPEAASLNVRQFGGGGVTQQDMTIGTGETSKMIIAPIAYTYKYVGDPIVVGDSSLPVYRRITADIAARTLGQQLKHAGAGLLDLGSFGDLSAENLTFYDKDYRITLDLVNAQASIYSNYMNRPDVYREAKQSDVLPESELIRIANEFLQKHGIRTSGYGAPVVDMQWKKDLEQRKLSDPESVEYVPTVINVVYPFALENSVAHDYNGTPEGMRVGVDILSKRVDSVSNLLAGGFESSRYSVETNNGTLKKFAEQGGLFSNPWYSEDMEVQELQLGTPTLVYVQHYLAEEISSGSREVFVPALQFPVMNVPAEGPFFHSRIVTIPIVQEIIDRAGKEQPIPTEPPVHILRGVSEPMMEKEIAQ